MDSFPPKLELKNRNSPFRDRMFRRPVVLCVPGVHRNLNSPIVGSAQVEFSYSTGKEYTGSLETYDVADVAAKSMRSSEFNKKVTDYGCFGCKLKTQN